MSRESAVSPAGKTTVVGLLIGAVAVAIQIAARGAPYPTVPPAFDLWTQSVAVLVAVLSGALATTTNLRYRRSVTT
jgi:hypothetical protein